MDDNTYNEPADRVGRGEWNTRYSIELDVTRVSTTAVEVGFEKHWRGSWDACLVSGLSRDMVCHGFMSMLRACRCRDWIKTEVLPRSRHLYLVSWLCLEFPCLVMSHVSWLCLDCVSVTYRVVSSEISGNFRKFIQIFPEISGNFLKSFFFLCQSAGSKSSDAVN